MPKLLSAEQMVQGITILLGLVFLQTLLAFFGGIAMVQFGRSARQRSAGGYLVRGIALWVAGAMIFMAILVSN